MLPADSERTRQLIVERLPGLIAARNEASGTSYPDIADYAIAKELNLSRADVREAIQTLEGEGSVRAVTRSGQYGDFLTVRPAPAHHADGNAPPPPPRYTGPLPQGAELLPAWPVLNALEDIEARLINAGIYETFVEPEAIATAAQLELGETQAALDVLEAAFLVLRPESGRYRSRIAEVCRLLKHVKQRWQDDQLATDPYLVRSLRVFFQPRRRQRRDRPLANELNTLAGQFESRANLRRASVLVKDAIQGAMGANVLLTRVQAEAIQAIGTAYQRRGRDDTSFVVTGDTGSGKTEAFAVPLLTGALQDAMAGIRGVKIILVYPRVRLAANQVERLTHYLAELAERVETPLSIGIQTGETPTELAGEEEWLPFRLFRCPRNECATELRIAVRARKHRHRLECPNSQCGWSYDHYVATREGLEAAPPDVLITTTESLNRWLTEPKWAHIFGLDKASNWAPPRAVVLDEIHLYDTIYGAQVTRLVRRLKHRIEQSMQRWPSEIPDVPGWKSPLLLGMSATIGGPQAFWQRFSGGRAIVLAPAMDDFEPTAAGREYFLFIRPESESRGQRIAVASAAIQSLMVLMHNLPRRMTPSGPKHRGLVFVESLDKLKRLHTDFMDAEEVRRLWKIRIGDSVGAPDAAPGATPPPSFPGFDEGEYWYFDAQDPDQYGRNRPTHGLPPASVAVAPATVSSQTKDVDAALAGDLVFATTSLEVGFDDPSLQVVFQYRSPRNPASFAQKRGRAGRQFGDRSVVATLLSMETFRDAYYFQSPGFLVSPGDYSPPINEDNFFVNRAHGLMAALDAATFERAVKGGRTSTWYVDSGRELRQRLAESRKLSRDAMVEAFRAVTSRLYQKREQGGFDAAWARFLEGLADRDAEHDWVANRSPILPSNLFGSINLPVVNTTLSGVPDTEIALDVGLALGELAPGRVTRRFGQTDLFWLLPRPRNGAVCFVREVSRTDHGFRDESIEELDASIPGFVDRLPLAARALYEGQGGLPTRLCRPESLHLARFGRYAPRAATPDVEWSYCAACDRLAKGGNTPACEGCGGRTARLDHRTNGGLLSYPIVIPETEAYDVVPTPRPLNAVLFATEIYAGYSSENEQDGTSSLLAYQVVYGAEVTYDTRRNGRHLRTYTTRAPDGAGGGPLLYGFKVHAEGLRLEIAPEPFTEVVSDALDALPAGARATLLRARVVFALANAERLESDVFLRRHSAEFVATAVALLSLGDRGAAWRDAATRDRALTAAAHYWTHAQRFSEESLDAYRLFLGREDVVTFVADIVDDKDAELAFAVDCAAHGLEHTLRAIFTIIGGVPDEEVGGVVELATLGTGSPQTIYIYERGEYGNGATRLVHDALRQPGGERSLWRKLWERAALCPVAYEEDFLRWLLRNHAGRLRQGREEMEAVSRSAEAADETERLLREVLGRIHRDQVLAGALGRLLLGRETLAGLELPHVELYLETDAVAREVEERFGRPGTVVEISNAALHAVSERPATFPNLSAARQRFQELYASGHAVDDDAPDLFDPAELPDIDERRTRVDEVRFVTLVERFALSACIDGCPACVAASCTLGSPSLMRHLVSRRLLHELVLGLVGRGAVNLDAARSAAAAVAAVEAIAAERDPGEWVAVVSEDHERFREVWESLAARGLSPFDEVFDLEKGRTFGVFLRHA